MRSKLIIRAAAVVATTFGLSSLPASGAGPAPVTVTADGETAPVSHARDSADDPSIWVDPHTPENSLIIGNDKHGALEVYNLSGSLRQRITSDTPFWGNVDVRQAVSIGGRTIDLVAVANSGLRFFTVDLATRRLTPATDGTKPLRAGGQGVCLYVSPKNGTPYVFTVNGTGLVRQWEIRDSNKDGRLDVTRVREIQVVQGAAPPEATESCAVDDANQALYVAEAKVALWRYGAEPMAGSTRTAIDRVKPRGNLVPDIEGITVAGDGRNGQVIASAQNVAAPNDSYFTVYDRVTNAYEGSFRIVGGSRSDGCERTDGVAAYAGSLGPSYPRGLFVCQDNRNTAPAAGNQNFKLTRLDRILAAVL